MSIIFPYSPLAVITYFSNLFSIDLSAISPYETMVLTIFSNLYFFIYWFIILYFALKIFNRLWERVF